MTRASFLTCLCLHLIASNYEHQTSENCKVALGWHWPKAGAGPLRGPGRHRRQLPRTWAGPHARPQRRGGGHWLAVEPSCVGGTVHSERPRTAVAGAPWGRVPEGAGGSPGLCVAVSLVGRYGLLGHPYLPFCLGAVVFLFV